MDIGGSQQLPHLHLDHIDHPKFGGSDSKISFNRFTCLIDRFSRLQVNNVRYL
ncbi:hypothetical protein D3C74_14430 [compost metagenome]